MKKALALLSLFVFTLSANATHNRSGEILYKRVAPFGTLNAPVYTYSITVIKYMDHGSLIADRCVDTVYFGDGQKGIAPRINGGTSLNCGCSGTIQCGQLILQQIGYTLKKSIYSILHTYSGAGTYTISSSDPNRNVGIHNIPNSGSVPFYIESLLVINSGNASNSSPEFGSDPVNQATLGVCFYDNLNASDADGDSLSYELIPCAAPGYFYPEIPLTGTLSMDAVSGLFTWCYPAVLAEYQVAYRVKEWRKNLSGTYVLNGFVMRDRQILVNIGTVSIDEQGVSQQIKAYPNPVITSLTLDLGNKLYSTIDYKVYTSAGILQGEGSAKKNANTFEIDLSTVQSGLYMVKLELDGIQKWFKVLKE
jgi:hypothetical protein